MDSTSTSDSWRWQRISWRAEEKRREPSEEGDSTTSTKTHSSRQALLDPYREALLRDSTSLEDMMYDLEEVLSQRPPPPAPRSLSSRRTTTTPSLHTPLPNHVDSLSNGYMSDSTLYRSAALSLPTRDPFAPPPPKPPHRLPTTARSTQPQAMTALGRALSAARLRMDDGAESPTPRRFSPLPSKESVLSTPAPTFSEAERLVLSPPWRRRALILPDSSSSSHFHPLPPPSPAHPLFSHAHSSSQSLVDSGMPSLRRGREPEAILVDQQRIRYTSASPNLPRRLLATTSFESVDASLGLPLSHPSALPPRSPSPSHPRLPAASVRIPPPPRPETSSVSCWTGPPTPAKPCGECVALRFALEQISAELNERRGVESSENATETEKVELQNREQQTIAAGIPTDVAVETEPVTIIEHGCEVDVDYVEEERVSEESEKERVPLTAMERVPLTDSATETDIASCSERETQTTSETSDRVTQTEGEESREDGETGESLWLVPSPPLQKSASLPPPLPPSFTPNSQHSPGSDPPADYEVVDALELAECQEKEEREEGAEREREEKSSSGERAEQTSGESTEEGQLPAEAVSAAVQRRLSVQQVESLRKLLTAEETKQFMRGGIFRSLRERPGLAKKEDEPQPPSSSSLHTSTPSEKPSEALKAKIELKKEIPPSTTRLPQPVPARIPRPKISKYSPEEQKAETAAEEDEAADRLTPLRSELRSLAASSSWPSSSGLPPSLSNVSTLHGDETETCSDSESEGSEGSYETNEQEESGPYEASETLFEALRTLDRHVSRVKQKQEVVEWAMKYVQHEWLKTAARKASRPERVGGFLKTVEGVSSQLRPFVVNIDDANGNTALHYAVSHANLAVAALLVDQDGQLDAANRAGYSPLMLAALTQINDENDVNIVHRLIRGGNVNARAEPHGQTALMLAVSHGKLQNAKLLLDSGADVNLQDEEGSTALMCAAEHGHTALVKLLLSHADIDASIADCDQSTALTIAVENGHKSIGILIYAHLNLRHSQDEHV